MSQPGALPVNAQEPPDGDPAAPPGTKASGLVFILSGPSGVGKSTLIGQLTRDGFPITYCVTATTRPRRADEVQGVDYYFMDDAEYDRLRDSGEFLEHATVHRLHRYGIPWFSLRRGLRKGCDVIMAPDVQGARTVRKQLEHAIAIFLMPPSLHELLPRLEARGTESDEERQIRMATARREVQAVSEYDYVVVNERDRLHQAVDRVKAIIHAERMRVNPRTISVT